MPRRVRWQRFVHCLIGLQPAVRGKRHDFVVEFAADNFVHCGRGVALVVVEVRGGGGAGSRVLAEDGPARTGMFRVLHAVLRGVVHHAVVEGAPMAEIYARLRERGFDGHRESAPRQD